jgi:hypothetical protein
VQVFASVRDVVVCFARRALAFPLYRHWALVEQVRPPHHYRSGPCKLAHRAHAGVCKVVRDTAAILRLGRRAAVACLLAMRHVLDRDEVKHWLSRLYLDDYCVWLQTCARCAWVAAPAAAAAISWTWLDPCLDVPLCACASLSVCVCVCVLLDCSERTVIALAEELAACPLAKSDVGWPLELLEAAARAAATDG